MFYLPSLNPLQISASYCRHLLVSLKKKFSKMSIVICDAKQSELTPHTWTCHV